MTTKPGAATAWPDAEILRVLAAAAAHLLRDHDCDAHGWEVTAAALAAYRERYPDKEVDGAAPAG